MKPNIKIVLKEFAVALPLYAVPAAAYVFFVLQFLGQWLCQLFQAERRLYAAVALLLIIGQGLILEFCTRALLEWIKGKKEK